jgi:hypothetical protein
MTLTAEIKITGAINDEEFGATGSASGDPQTGQWHLRLDYSNFPANWHPFLYVDAKVGLIYYREHEGGRNMLSLSDGSFRASSTIDLGHGFILRNNAEIKKVSQTHFRASYLMYGTIRTFELTEIESFQEIMVPAGPGRVAGLALARWRGGVEKLEAIQSTRYDFETARTLDQTQLRVLTAEPSLSRHTVEIDYRTEVAPFSSFGNIFTPAGLHVAS